MKSFMFSCNRVRNTWLVIFLLFIVTVGIIIGCGKLKDEEHSGSSVGTTGAIPLPVGPQSSWGTFSLSTWAHPPSIPADGVTASTVKAQLEDTSGGSLENFLMTFNTIPSSDAICAFMVPASAPGGPISYSTETTGRTGENGKVSVFVYGIRSGSCVIQATLDVDEDGAEDLFDTTLVTVTGGTGVPGDEVAGVELTVDDPYKTINLGVCGETEPGSQTFTLTATVWDENGDPVGAGVRVELSGDISMSTVYWGETDANGQVTWTYTATAGSVGVYSYTVTATTVIAGETYTDTITFSLAAECDVPTPTPVPTVTPTPTPTLDVISNQLTVSADGVTAGYPTTATITGCATSGGAPENGLTVFYTISGTGTGAGDLSASSDVTTATAPSGCTDGITYDPVAASSGNTITITGTTVDGRSDAVSIAVVP